MLEFVEQYKVVLSWIVPSGLVLIATVIQYAIGWRRLLDKLQDTLERKVDKEDCLMACGNKLEVEIFHEAQRNCVETVLTAMEKQRNELEKDIDRIGSEINPIWKAHTELSTEVAGSTAKLNEAVDTMKEAVREIRSANGRG